MLFFCCFKQKTAYEMRISDWSSDVCASDLIGAFAIGAIAAAALQNRRNSRGADDSAPGRTARHGWGRKFGDYTVIGKTVTINRPREELFAFWRDFQNLPTFMENIEKVEETGEDRKSTRLNSSH